MEKNHRSSWAVVGLVLALALVTAPADSRATVTSPQEQFGFNIGDDYHLLTYSQLMDYWRKLDEQSPRMRLVEMGKTAEGRPQLMAVITSPANHKKLDRYKQIARRLVWRKA
jgi:hypothetical protein